MPLAFVFYEVVIRNFKIVVGLEFRWESGSGGVFFVRPKGFLNSIIWDSYANFHRYIGQFLICGLNEVAIKSTQRDVELDKFIWRDIFTKCGGKVAPELARWDGKNSFIVGKDLSKKAKVLVKPSNSYMGYGDERLFDFDLKNNKKEIISYMKEKFNDQPAIIMDFIKPSKDYGIHSIDIVTITLPNGDI